MEEKKQNKRERRREIVAKRRWKKVKGTKKKCELGSKN